MWTIGITTVLHTRQPHTTITNKHINDHNPSSHKHAADRETCHKIIDSIEDEMKQEIKLSTRMNKREVIVFVFASIITRRAFGCVS